MRGGKAARAAAPSAGDPRRVDLLGGKIGAEATPARSSVQAEHIVPCAEPAVLVTDSSKSGPEGSFGESSSSAEQKLPILKMFERADWTLFRTVEGLQQKAGVPATRLRRLVLKEIADNALDVGRIKYGIIEPEKFFIEDDGSGLDGTPEQIAELYSIRRPLRSSKLLRLPQRGQLGNGLRVVAGAVLASGGLLAVVTRNRRIVLRPESDGSTTVVKVVQAKFSVGTRIEIGFGPALPNDLAPFAWVDAAQSVSAAGEAYRGRSSPFWYDPAQFHELLLASGAQPVRSLISQLDGCTGGKAGEIVSAARLDRARCQDVKRQQAIKLLEIARAHVRPVTPERLGCVGRGVFPKCKYAVQFGTAELGSTTPKAVIPYVVEAWARSTSGPAKKATDDVRVSVLVNRTPVTDDVSAWRSSERDLCLQGSGLSHYCSDAPKRGSYDVILHITTPYCPITSDGKAPDLAAFAGHILVAVEEAMRKAQRAAPKDKKVSQKDVVLDNLDEAVSKASGDGEYRFNERQIFYQLRPIVLEETGQELRVGNFKAILTDYENEKGEIPGMYREPRGSIYHPHRGDDIPLGTLTVEEYERPAWTFNKLLYVEKEGFSEALKEDGWPERHDCALMSSKGFTARAARDLVDKLAKHDEPVTIFCVHDADAYGTMIYQTFQEETKARRARKIKILNLGLEPWEAVEAGLEVEEVEKGDQRKPVADYVLEHEDGKDWSEWLQRNRVELNAMTTPQFIAWLDAKMTEQGDGKLIPPDDVLTGELEKQLDEKVRDAVTERILREAGLEGQVAEVLETIERPSASDLKDRIRRLFQGTPEREWRDEIENAADDLSGGSPS
jgi:hypothetical protein